MGDDEETAAHASDTLARKLIKNGEQNHKLNFPGDHNEVYPAEKKTSSKFIGVSFNIKESNWKVQRWSKNKWFYNGHYDDEETTARARDTLARKLMKSGDQTLKLNFPDDDYENEETAARASDTLARKLIKNGEQNHKLNFP